MKIYSEYNKEEKQLELMFSGSGISSTCILKDEWDKNYTVDSLIGWFNHILKKIDASGVDIKRLEERMEEIANQPRGDRCTT